jgi:hypothetical protein
MAIEKLKIKLKNKTWNNPQIKEAINSHLPDHRHKTKK